jgi:hypothetical protein
MPSSPSLQAWCELGGFVANVVIEPNATSTGQNRCERGPPKSPAENLAVQLDQIDWARLGRSGGGLDPLFLFKRYAMELMSCSDLYGFGRKR